MSESAVAVAPVPAGHASKPLTPARRPVPEHLLTERRPLGAPWDKLMMWLFLGSDAMGFAGLLGAYAALRAGDETWPIPQQLLGINFTGIMTFVLICSSVTMVKSFEAIQNDDRRACWNWLFATFLGGVFFLAGQCYEYTHLIEHGVTLRSSNFAATLYSITGFHGCHVFVPRLRKQGRGHVLNVGSAAGLLSPPKMGPYNATKAAVVSLSETLYADLAGTGVGVTVLCPTFVKTNLVRSMHSTADEALGAAGQKVMDSAGSSPEAVVRAALAGVERNALHVAPQPDGRWLWRLKRLAPQRFHQLSHVVIDALVARLSKPA